MRLHTCTITAGLVGVLCFGTASIALADDVPGIRQDPPGVASIRGRVTTQTGTVALPGVTVTLLGEMDDAQIASTVTDAQGQFLFSAVPAGRFRLRAQFAGFNEVVSERLTLTAGRDLEVDIEIPLGLSTSVEAVAQAQDIPLTGTSQQTLTGSMIDIAPVRGDDYRSLLPILPGVVRGPDGRINMKGGRPSQTGLQVGESYASDPTTGDVAVGLPVDAVATIDVLPNPYTAEFGRFSAGVTRIETRQGGDTWSFTANNFIPVPCLKICNGGNLGVRSYDPRFVVSGPLVPGRVFLAQSAQYRDHRNRVTSLPIGEADTKLRSLETFTRLDASLNQHQVNATVAVFPQNLDYVGLNTFNRRPVTPSMTRRGYSIAVTDSLRLSDTSVLESSLSTTRFDLGVRRSGSDAMVFTPDERLGSFFNQQNRRSRTTQWLETLSFVNEGAGQHLVKIGVDALWTSFDGWSESAPVEVRRADGTLSQRLEYGGLTTQRVREIDVGAFVQDKWRINDRVLLELGARLDRDGVTDHVRLSPRLGFVLGVLPEGRGILRGGIGLFSERTPLLAGAFAAIEAPTLTRFAADGQTPAGSAVAFEHRVAPDLKPTAARVWNVEYDHRLPQGWLLKVNHLERIGRNELLIDPSEEGSAGVIRLASRGRSRYRETEVTARHADGSGREMTATYVHSRSEGNLNAFDSYFGNMRNPILRFDQYGRTGVDVPHRFIALAVLPLGKWRASPLLEVRNGFPYSVIDEDQNFVGARNAGGRFPLFYTIDFRLSRLVTLRGRQVRIGFRSTHLLRNFLPRDVQANVHSPGFGSFYNPISRRLGFTIDIQG